MDKIIEEMAKDIYYAIQKECKLNTYGHCNDCEFNVPKNTNEIDCQSYLVSKILSQMNYQKLPEDSVVLTREEYERIKSLYDTQKGAIMTSSIGDLPLTVESLRKAVDEITRLINVQTELQEFNVKYYNDAKDLRRELKQARKETAREILDEFNNFLPDRATSNIVIKKDSLEDVRKALTVLAQAYHDKTQELAKQYGVEIKE